MIVNFRSSINPINDPGIMNALVMSGCRLSCIDVVINYYLALNPCQGKIYSHMFNSDYSTEMNESSSEIVVNISDRI